MQSSSVTDLASSPSIPPDREFIPSLSVHLAFLLLSLFMNRQVSMCYRSWFISASTSRVKVRSIKPLASLLKLAANAAWHSSALDICLVKAVQRPPRVKATIGELKALHAPTQCLCSTPRSPAPGCWAQQKGAACASSSSCWDTSAALHTSEGTKRGMLTRLRGARLRPGPCCQAGWTDLIYTINRTLKIDFSKKVQILLQHHWYSQIPTVWVAN